MTNTDSYIQQIADYFDNSVTQASDDELFACGYLRGHIDLAVGQLQQTEQPFTVTQLQIAVVDSLAQAIKAGELNPADEQLVQRIWQQLA